MEVIGFHKSTFNFDDGRASSGYTLYLGSVITEFDGKGMRAERVYLSNNKLNGYIPKLGDDVLIDRSSSGSARGIVLLKPAQIK